MNNKCLGCGVHLQSNDKNKIGYVNENKIKDAKFCERCFKIRNYGEFKTVEFKNDEYIKIYKNINDTNDLVLFLADIFNLDSSLNMINKYIKNKIILVVTKYDIIPKSVKENKIKEKIKSYNFNSNVIDTVIISSKNNYNIDFLYNMIKKYKTSKYVYITGNTNVGKSTLINKMIKNYTDNDIQITTSILPSTTLNINEVNISKDLVLLDTPGFIEFDNINNYINPKKLKKVMPNSEIKPITYQLEAGKTLLIDELARIEYVKGEKNSFTFYISNDIIVSRINTITNDRGKNLECHNIDVMPYEDVIINGLCFIKITKSASIKLYTIKGVSVYKRKSLI